MSYIRYKNNKLFIENVSVNQLASKLKTPFYLYSEGNIVENYNIPLIKKDNFKFSSDINKIEKKIFELRDNDFDIFESENDYIL